MKRLFRNEILGIVIATIAAGATYRAGINYLPSVFLIGAGILMLAVFAELNRKFDDQGIRPHNCPLLFCNTTVIHHGFDDLPNLAENCSDEFEVLVHYRRVKDKIREIESTLHEDFERL